MFGALRRLAGLVLVAATLCGCPALLEDNFETDSVTASGGSGSGQVADSGSAATGGETDGAACNCTPPKICCSDVCVDPSSDASNCGDCGVGCPGTTCVSGQCTNLCAFGFLDCDHNVVTGCEVDAATDSDHCGSCDVACAFDQTCVAGECTCAPGTANCDGDIKNGCETIVASDVANCGACGTTCGAHQSCINSSCACESGFADCNGNGNDGCEASLADPRSCGACGHDCGDGSTCNNGNCGCASGFLDCDQTPGCEASATSPSSCGNCNLQCSGTTPMCDGTSCVAFCGTGQTLCGAGSCVDLATDPTNCGQCGNRVAANQTCVGGIPTCNAGFGDCNGLQKDGCETDVDSNTSSCGSCGNVCKPGAICSGGKCLCAASTPHDCGTACRACCSATDCSDGNPCTVDTCTTSGTCSFSAECPNGGKCCGLQSCAQCCSDADCGSGTVCSSNQCVGSTCMAPLTLCGTSCVDQQTSSQNCGGCGNDCGLGRTCVAAQCTPAWVTMSVPSGFAARSKTAYTWTGSRVFIWGGVDATGSALDSGVLYDPVADTWSTTLVGTNTPSGRVLATAVWTGSVVVVFGGGDPQDTVDYASGGRYEPLSNTWQAMTTNGAPTPRRAAIGVWTGTHVLIWGGYNRDGLPEANAYLYDPINDQWTLTNTNNQPPKLLHATTGWSGIEFYVYGGRPNGTGEDDKLYAYKPSTNTWRHGPNGPSSRYGAVGGWDGNRFIAWSGRKDSNAPFSDGKRYDPLAGAAGSWTSMTTSGLPATRWMPWQESGWTARISGGNLLMVGGLADSGTTVHKDAASYNSITNTFRQIGAWPSGEQHQWAAGVWTGAEFVLWGGLDGSLPTATGERLRP